MLTDSLIKAAEIAPAEARVSDPTRAMTYQDLLRLADVMRRQVEGVTRNPHVGLMLPSSVGFSAAFFGTLWAGRTAVPLNFLLGPAELSAVVRDAGLDVIFTIRHFSEAVAKLPVKIVYLEDLPLKREMVLSRIRRMGALPKTNPEDTAVLLYTSGTSGVPKGVCQTFGNLRYDVDACIEKAKLTTHHRFLGVLPLFHSFGLTAMCLVPTTLAASVHYVPRFHPAGLFEIIREQQSSVTMMIASMYTAMLRARHGKAEDLRSIQYAISGGEALSPLVYQTFRDRFDVTILQGYGMTEAAPVVSLNMPWAHKEGSVGQAIPGVEVCAFDEVGRAMERGSDGELWVRGPIVMKGYYQKEADTRAVLTPEGWYKTGDMGCVDADGFITITGRKKEMIIVGGENVYPREIECVLEDHPAVAEAAVVGHQDSSRGEVVVAFVMQKEGQSVTELALREFCRARVAGYKVPRRVVIAEDLPRGPTGKILKRRLKELL